MLRFSLPSVPGDGAGKSAAVNIPFSYAARTGEVLAEQVKDVVVDAVGVVVTASGESAGIDDPERRACLNGSDGRKLPTIGQNARRSLVSLQASLSKRSRRAQCKVPPLQPERPDFSFA
jgi:hypothetical protein